MAKASLTAYIVPSDDQHLSEYTHPHYQRRYHLTNFDGSAGTALVTLTDAYLWTDSRYYEQAQAQLPPSFKLMKSGEPTTPTLPKFLASLQPVPKIGLDPSLFPSSFIANLEKLLPPNSLVFTPNNLIDETWLDRPSPPSSKFRVHPLKFAGLSVADKVKKVGQQMTKEGATLLVLGMLDEVAYLLNLRASDVECNPVGIAYATVHMDPASNEPVATIFTNDGKLEDVKDFLKEHNVQAQPYEGIAAAIKNHPSAGKVWVDQARANHALTLDVSKEQLLTKSNPIAAMKAVKNESELEGMREAHRIDGAAMASFISWLSRAVDDRWCGSEVAGVGECEVDLVLNAARDEASKGTFLEPSFPTIAGVDSNGAIVHYRANAESENFLTPESACMLLDSGGQFTMGTTDVTRTWHFGPKPRDDVKEAYTRVLKGNIGLDTLVFPEDTPGAVIDSFARRSLWEAGMDYGHGTGHGVGAALNVHEGPQSISPRLGNSEGLKRGMIVSNEPGFYKTGDFGIRIENLLVVVGVEEAGGKLEKKESFEEFQKREKERKAGGGGGGGGGGGKQFVKFEKLTLIPIQKSLIDVSIMTKQELDWLDEYHERVLREIEPRIQKGGEAWRWLKRSCEPIERESSSRTA